MKSVLAALALLSTGVAAEAACFGSDDFYTCSDSSGNRYTVNRFGDTTMMRGSNSRTGSSWSQNSFDLGDTTITRGRDADGNSWNMRQTDLGGGFRTYSGRDSDGNSFSGTCGAFGCN
jgi:hypothetical protein